MSDSNGKKEAVSVKGSLYEATRLILLAGIGAVALAQEEMNTFLDRLVERGELAEGDARKLVREMVERREKLEKERKARSGQAKPPAPATRSDIDALNARVADLTRQIEELRKAQS
jgi:polyhydroxyalkanoate synthesis regulator phasin